MHFLGKNIRHLRKQNSKTQAELASHLDRGQTTIGNWENGISEPGVEELITLSNFFDISLDNLLKIDLSLTNWQSGPREERTTSPVSYEIPERAPLLAQEEKDNSLTYALSELRTFVQTEFRSVRNEMNELHARLEAREEVRTPLPADKEQKNGQR